ncbi:MAG: SIS domain-containing protein [Thermosynechococcaceae cyanobacterium]
MSYLANILEQPAVLRSQLQTYKEHEVWQHIQQAGKTDQTVVLTGMGASYNALYPTWFYLHQQGIPAVHIEASELIYYSDSLLRQRCLLVVVSQSGNSVEIGRIIERIQASGSQPFMISVTTGSDNNLAAHSTVQLCTQAGAEVGVATKTYTSTLLLLHWLGRAIAGQLQPDDYVAVDAIATSTATILENWQTWIEPAYHQLQGTTYAALMGRGPSLTSALNGGLILKEAVRLPAEGFSGGRFRHGPMELLSPHVGCIVFTTPGKTLELSQRLATDIVERGGQLVTIGDAISSTQPHAHLPLPETDEALSPILEILGPQLLAAKLAEQRGLTPGEFRWSGKVIHTE